MRKVVFYKLLPKDLPVNPCKLWRGVKNQSLLPLLCTIVAASLKAMTKTSQRQTSMDKME